MDNPERVIKANNLKLILSVMLFLVFVLIGFFMLSAGDNPNTTVGKLGLTFEIGLISVMFFGLGVFVFGYLLLFGNAKLKLSNNGLYCKSLYKGWQVKWSDIDKISLDSMFSQKLIYIYLTEKGKADYQANYGFNNTVRRINFATGFKYDLSIGNIYKIKPQELFELLKEYHEKYKAEANTILKENY